MYCVYSTCKVYYCQYNCVCDMYCTVCVHYILYPIFHKHQLQYWHVTRLYKVLLKSWFAHADQLMDQG